jgi:hypothetical protein
VPHRGERVKQRTMHARNWNDCYTNCKILSSVSACLNVHTSDELFSGQLLVFWAVVKPPLFSRARMSVIFFAGGVHALVFEEKFDTYTLYKRAFYLILDTF